MHSFSYLNTAKAIIQSYDGTMPFAIWLKQFFGANKKFGSTDRKQISHACYCYYRLGNAFQNSDVEEKILIGLFLCSATSNKILEELKPEWNEKIHFSMEQKLEVLFALPEINFIFPFPEEVSAEIDLAEFNRSFLMQPDIFLRLRPGHEEKVFLKLREAQTAYVQLNTNCVQISNQTKISEILELDTEALIQDYSSQQVGTFFENLKLQTSNFKPLVWDCCAASGGKSILFHDYFPYAYFTVSDVRESILINLRKRFKRAGIHNYVSFVKNLSTEKLSAHKKFDVVICDAPCSGSGTWSRTPEQLSFFKKEKINEYACLQKKIVANASESVKQNGFFLYITCSVFKKENEEIVAYIQQNLSFQLRSIHYFKGYNRKADTLFAALFCHL